MGVSQSNKQKEPQMSFSQHERGADDGHWQSKYLGRRGVIARDREAYEEVRFWVFNRPTDYPSLLKGEVDGFVLRCRDTLFAYASTVYSAKLFRPIFAMRELVRLVGEIEHLSTQIAFTSSQKEVLMAFHAYLRHYDVWVTGEQGRMRRSAALGREILADDKAPFATRLFASARISKIRDCVSEEERVNCHLEVVLALDAVTNDKQLLGLDQGWKTVARLGMLIGAWEYVDLAHKHDPSRDIRIKAYTQVGFIWYKIKKGIFGK